nr:putative membrane protein [Quercus suber]
MDMDSEISRGRSPSCEPGWRNMPNKGQLAILAASRFVDFLQMAALQTLMVHQLRSFDPDLPDSMISQQAGVLQGSFTAAQILTSVLWGRAADQPLIGRKLVLNIGLVGTGIGCVGVGFSSSYRQAVVWRLLTGAIDGTVGAARTMVAERTPKPWHPCAFLLLPAASNLANVLGPILAGILVNPADRMARLFEVGGTFGGVEWVRSYPFALANLLSAVLLFAEAVLVFYGLEETLATKRPLHLVEGSPVRTSRLAQGSHSKEKGFYILHQPQQYAVLAGQAHHQSVNVGCIARPGDKQGPQPTQRRSFSQITISGMVAIPTVAGLLDLIPDSSCKLAIASHRTYPPSAAVSGCIPLISTTRC